MQEISIEGGCSRVEGDIFSYHWSDNDGFHTVLFDTFGIAPKIGDKVVNGQLVPLIGYKINDDTSHWRSYEDHEWPNDFF